MYKNYTRKPGMPKGYVHKILLIMRLTTVLLIATMMQVSAASYGQRITLNAKNVPLLEVFKEIRVQTGYDFMFERQLIAKGNRVNIRVTNASLDEVLQRCFETQTFTYAIEDKTIVVKAKEESVLGNLAHYLASITVSGILIDEKGQPLPGASVKVKATNKYTTTNKYGAFTLTNVDENAIIVISFIGYDPIEVKATPNLGTITLVMANSKLDEVQVQAYGQISRRLNTGNIGTVKAADIEKQPVTNPLLALQGRVAGLFISQGSGLPNSTVKVNIRGTNTIAQQTDPLYVIDGLPYSTDMLLNVGYSGSGQASPFSFLNPANVESIDVLKDADATAIYGSRGANGVILITTKKGQAGSTKFDINVYSGMSKIPRKLDLMNTQEFLAMRREAYANDGEEIPSYAVDLTEWDPNRNVDWQERLIGQNSFTTDAQVGVTGGSDNTQYRVFGGYNRNTPPFPRSFKSQKVSGGISLSTASVNRRFHVTFGINYLSDQTYLPVYDPTTNLTLSPNAPEAYNPDGTLNFQDYRSSNPFSGFENWYRGKTNNLITNVSISYDISSAITFRLTGGYNNTVVNGIAATTIASRLGNPDYQDPTATSEFSYNTTSSWITEPQLSYRAHFLAGTWELLAGSTFQGGNANGQLITGNGYRNDGLLNSLAAASSINKGMSTLEESRFTSLYGRLNYNYLDKYLLNLTGRRDGSSRFGPGKKFGNFGAAGVAWIFSKESFVSKNIPLLSFGKLRASYGVTGNEPGGNYNYLALNSFSTYRRPYQNITVLTPDNLLSPDYAWEEVKKMEAGVELGFFKDRVLVTASYFKNRSTNQLINYSLPLITGFQTVLVNRDATVQNKGFEFTFSTVNVKSQWFSWKSEFNMSVLRNKLVAFPNIENTPYFGSLFVGEALSTMPYYRAAGVDPETGIYQFYTSDGKLTFDPDYIKDPTKHFSFDPAFYGGLQNSFNFRQFSLDVFFQFVKQKGRNYFFNNGSVAAGTSYLGNNNQPRELLDRWQKPGDVAFFKGILDYTGTQLNTPRTYASSRFVQKNNFIAGESASVYYRFSDRINKSLGLQNTKVTLFTSDLFRAASIKRERGLDYPFSHSFTLQLQTTF